MVDFIGAAINDLSAEQLRKLAKELSRDIWKLGVQADYLDRRNDARKRYRLPAARPSKQQIKKIAIRVRNMWIVRQARAGKLNREIAPKVALSPSQVSRIVKAGIRTECLERTPDVDAGTLTDALIDELEYREWLAGRASHARMVHGVPPADESAPESILPP